MTVGNTENPIARPSILPVIQAINAYRIYFFEIWLVLYPRPFNVPILILCSSTILVIVVKHTKAATAKKKTGNIFAKASILLAQPSYSTNDWWLSLSKIYKVGFSIFLICFLASFIFSSPSAIFSSASWSSFLALFSSVLSLALFSFNSSFASSIWFSLWDNSSSAFLNFSSANFSEDFNFVFSFAIFFSLASKVAFVSFNFFSPNNNSDLLLSNLSVPSLYFCCITDSIYRFSFNLFSSSLLSTSDNCSFWSCFSISLFPFFKSSIWLLNSSKSLSAFFISLSAVFLLLLNFFKAVWYFFWPFFKSVSALASLTLPSSICSKALFFSFFNWAFPSSICSLASSILFSASLISFSDFNLFSSYSFLPLSKSFFAFDNLSSCFCILSSAFFTTSLYLLVVSLFFIFSILSVTVLTRFEYSSPYVSSSFADFTVKNISV